MSKMSENNGCEITVTAKDGLIELSNNGFNFVDCGRVSWVSGDRGTSLEGFAIRPSETAILPTLQGIKITSTQITIAISSLASPREQSWFYLLKVNGVWHESVLSSPGANEEEEPELINGTPQN